MESLELTLPSGWHTGGEWFRNATLRPLNGWDEELVAGAAGLSPAERTTAILARCLLRLGPWVPPTAEQVRSLTVGDREALLLLLRRLTLGERIACVLRCPACSDKLDLDLAVSELLQPPYADPRPLHEATIPGDDGVWQVSFRLPTGADQEAAAAIASTRGVDAAVASLLQGCITRADPAEIPAAVQDKLADLMAELDPQAESLLSLECPACAHQFSTTLDIADLLFREVGDRLDGLYREIHVLALHYHWSESALLDLPREKRLRYLGLLAESRMQSSAA